MKIYDCFMYYDEDTVVDIRLNCLDAYVDKFLIVESKFTHSGKKRNLLFDIKFRYTFIYFQVINSFFFFYNFVNSFDAQRLFIKFYMI